jgi:hypothetical protein
VIPNPEFKRNLWLELTPHRLIAAPVILALLLPLVVSVRPEAWNNPVAYTAAAVFFAVTLLWGGRQAYDAIVDEVREHTWDTQRMSALGPWEMTLGKLLGATAFHWYVGGFCLAVFVFSFDAEAASVLRHWDTLRACAGLVFAALIVQAIGFLSGLIAVRAGRAIRPSRTLPITVLGLIVLLGFGRLLIGQAEGTVQWFGTSWHGRDFMLTSLVAFTAWAWLGAYRLMSDLLQVRVIPWAGVAFVLFSSVYVWGFLDSALRDSVRTFAAIGASIGGAWVYVAAWKERRDWIVVRRCLHAWQGEPLDRALRATPDWAPVALFALISALATSLDAAWDSPVRYGFPGRDIWDWLFYSPLTAVLLMFRDIGLLYFFSLGDRPERANSTTLVYLALLYAVVPSLLNLADLGFLALPIIPPPTPGGFWLGPFIAALHAGGVLMLLLRRYRQTQTGLLIDR